MRSIFFAYLENEFELAEEEDIVATAVAAIEELVGELSSFDDKTKFAIAVTGAKLGVSGGGGINAKEKMLIDTVFGQFWQGSMEQVYEQKMSVNFGIVSEYTIREGNASSPLMQGLCRKVLAEALTGFEWAPGPGWVKAENKNTPAKCDTPVLRTGAFLCAKRR
jgi:hypothetical protein